MFKADMETLLLDIPAPLVDRASGRDAKAAVAAQKRTELLAREAAREAARVAPRASTPRPVRKRRRTRGFMDFLTTRLFGVSHYEAMLTWNAFVRDFRSVWAP